MYKNIWLLLNVVKEKMDSKIFYWKQFVQIAEVCELEMIMIHMWNLDLDLDLD
jgi:hypothetical protein